MASSLLPAAFAAVLATGCGKAPEATPPDDPPGPGALQLEVATPARWLFVWAADRDGADSDFLAVLDADPDSPAYGSVVTTLPVGHRGTMPHHTEHRMPPGDTLFANGFRAGETFRFDLTDPPRPRLLGALGQAGGYTFPHSYERLPNGNVLATFQGRGPDNLDPGGLVELDPRGAVVRSASAADPRAGDALIRPYSLAVVPALDRIVVTSYDMGEDLGFDGGRRGRTRVVQVWRLSDLTVLATVDLPPQPGGGGDEQPGEPRLLEDGRTVLVSTFTCGLYRMVGLEGEDPRAEPVHRFAGGGCAVPVPVGRFWVQPVPSAHALIALDVSDPSAPVEVSRLELGPRSFPHWLAIDEASDRIAITDRGDGEARMFVARLDPASGVLALDEGFRDPRTDTVGVSFDRGSWPHGSTGPARPHGSVFSRDAGGPPER